MVASFEAKLPKRRPEREKSLETQRLARLDLRDRTPRQGDLVSSPDSTAASKIRETI